MSILDRALRMGEARQFKQYAKRVDQINAWEPELELLDDAELRANADGLRERARNGEPLEDLLSETFALVRLAREWDRLAASGCSVHVAAREARVVRARRRRGCRPAGSGARRGAGASVRRARRSMPLPVTSAGGRAPAAAGGVDHGVGGCTRTDADGRSRASPRR